MVNGWSTEHPLSFGEVKVAKKSNEMMAIPELLALVDCKKSISNMDAVDYQKFMATKIIAKEANYVLSLQKIKQFYTKKYLIIC